jgi:hypothetical protein
MILMVEVAINSSGSGDGDGSGGDDGNSGNRDNRGKSSRNSVDWEVEQMKGNGWRGNDVGGGRTGSGSDCGRYLI